MEQLIPKIAEYGIGVLCLAGLFVLVYYLLKQQNETTQKAIDENKLQTKEFIDVTREFKEVVKEQNIRIETKLDNINEKIDNISRTQQAQQVQERINQMMHHEYDTLQH